MNPFTLKELRQFTRSKIISGTLMGFLFIALLLSYFIPVGGIRYNTGATLFGSIVMVLGILTFFIVPMNVFVRMMKERGGKRAADLTLATSLSPASIIDGKIRSAFALIGISLTAVLPFASFAYLLHGVTLTQMAETLLTIGLIALVLVHFAILVASLRLSPIFRWIIYILALIPTFFGSVGGGIFQMEIFSGNPFNRTFFIALAIAISVSLLMRAFAISTLTPRTREHDFQLRLTTILLVVAWGVYAFSWWHDPIVEAVTALKSWSCISMAVFGALAIAASAQPFGYSRRQLAAYQVMPIWKRVLFWPFMSGAKNGLFFAISGAILLALVIPLLADKINARYVAEKVMVYYSGQGESFRAEDYSYSFLVFVIYNSSILLFFRALWRLAVRWWQNLSPVLVIGCSLLTIALLQSLPALLGADVGIMPFCYFELKNVFIYEIHFAWAYGAFALALVLNLIVSYCSRSTSLSRFL